MEAECRNIIKELWIVPVTAVLIAAVSFSGLRFCFAVGGSMKPALKSGELLLLDTKENKPDRYDIIVFRDSSQGMLIKRVMGLPGEHIQAADNRIYINGEPVNDPAGVSMEEYGFLEGGVSWETTNISQWATTGMNPWTAGNLVL